LLGIIAIEIGINKEGVPVGARGVADADVNRGKLCVKGIFEHEVFESSGRGTVPLMRSNIHDEYK
jgi:assimilatory nitrate reductase catalytic subunit